MGKFILEITTSIPLHRFKQMVFGNVISGAVALGTSATILAMGWLQDGFVFFSLGVKDGKRYSMPASNPTPHERNTI